MSDLRRIDADNADANGTGRDSRVDELLVEGLDRYFHGQFEDAIHLWTRVLFLDRTHASARAYIDRARGAIAERQRRAEVSLQQVTSLLEQGRAAEARHHLHQAVQALGEDERTSALRLRLERLDRVSGGLPGGAPRIRAAVDPDRVWWGDWLSSHLTLRVWLGAAVMVIMAVGLTSRAVQERLGLASPPTAPVPTVAVSPLPVLSSADVALVRARTLFARGRLADALWALDRVGPEQTARVDADTLRVEIQRLLLATAGERRTSGGPR